MTLDAIKEAIEHLPEQDRRLLAEWFDHLEQAAWDDQIERDFAVGGRGEALLNQIRREISDGEARPLGEGITGRRSS